MTASKLLLSPLRTRATRCTPPALTRGARALLPSLVLALVLVLAGCASVAPPRPGAPAPPPRPGAPAAPPPGTEAPPAAKPTPADAPPGAPPGAPATPTPSARTAGAELLAIEQRWLQEWFRGTPVRIAQRSDGSLAVDVPREFCFDVGRSQVKPALGAVLDKVAESLRRRPGTRLTLLSAPGDPAGSGSSAATATLALQRAAGVQRHLRDRGIALARLGEPVADGNASVQLRIGTVAPSP